MNDFSSNNLIFSRNLSINCNGRLMDLHTPKIMGIINVTDDSFYEGSRFNDPQSILEAAGRMIEEGADIIDIGGCSSRPGAVLVSEEEEYNRLNMALGRLRNAFPDLVISVDTYRSGIAKRVVPEYRVDIINDISAGEMDHHMIKTIAKLNVPYIIMHMQGTPETMQKNPVYDNVLDEILRFFGQKVNLLRKEGISDIIIDPGFGFGKSVEHNFTILNNLETFRMLELPLLVGLSRKSMIYRTLDIQPGESLNGTTAVHMAALLKGANILRVHDIKAARETIKLFNEMVKSGK
ncbi:MAG: dihydropteroate synthase [Bacteroidales bacterium]|nr:dihydropteroate synthase [Bacteroidales bacterium]MBN2697264.1 dihydropteroate synthase [Bacteroidales bacterium]